MEGSIKELKKELAGKANIVVINTDHPENYEFSQTLGIRVVPTLMFLDKDKQLVNAVEGALTKEAILEQFKKAGVE